MRGDRSAVAARAVARLARHGAQAPGRAGGGAKTGRSPRTVIRGEFNGQLAVSVDFLNFTFASADVAAVVREVCAFVGVSGGEDRVRGLHGYERSVDVGGFAVVAHGGVEQRGTVLVSINGAGCQRIADFGAMRRWGEAVGARITRLDIAGDDISGRLLGVGRCLRAWGAGQFDRRGTACKARIVDDLNSGDGSTLYIGTREGGKVCRVYEKGKQMGDVASKWVRCEVEFHAKDRVIPWAAVSDPRPYFAGAYPYLSKFELVEMRLRTFKHLHGLTLDVLTAWAKSAVGRTVNVLLRETEGDLGAVVEMIRRDGVPRRLVEFESCPLERAA